jgi:DNA processing protein
MNVDFQTVTPQELLGPLNETERKNAPGALYVAGDRSILKRGPCVSIVGSRRTSRDGLERARELARLLVEREVAVVSGLAAGIDTAAHRAAIEHGWRTVAVLGTPLDQVYPRENAEFQALIMKEHLAVSQFASGAAVRPWNFPMRNRTMALLSQASVIVEAGETSGALSQGWEALRLGRPLYLMRAIVDNPRLKWPRKMMDYGAQPFGYEDLKELVEEVRLQHEAREVELTF